MNVVTNKHKLTILEWDITVDVNGLVVFEKFKCPDCELIYDCYEDSDLGLPDTVVCNECQFNMKSLEHSEAMLEFEVGVEEEDLKRTGLTEAQVNTKVGELLLLALEEGVKEAQKRDLPIIGGCSD